MIQAHTNNNNLDNNDVIMFEQDDNLDKPSNLQKEQVEIPDHNKKRSLFLVKEEESNEDTQQIQDAHTSNSQQSKSNLIQATQSSGKTSLFSIAENKSQQFFPQGSNSMINQEEQNPQQFQRKKINSITTLHINNQEGYRIGQYYKDKFNPTEEHNRIQSQKMFNYDASSQRIFKESSARVDPLIDATTPQVIKDNEDKDTPHEDQNQGNSQGTPPNFKLNDLPSDELLQQQGNKIGTQELYSQALLNSQLTRSQKVDLIYNPVPKNTTIELFIVRDDHKLHYFAPRYHLFFNQNNNYIMSSRKEAVSVSPSYTISLSENNFSKKSSNYIGRMKSDILDNTYQIFDNGERPDDCKNKEKLRCELALIHFSQDHNQLFNKMQVGIPKLVNEQVPEKIQLSKNRSFFFNMFQDDEIQTNLQIFSSKAPIFDENKKVYVLNFKENVLPSQKNFQLTSEKNKKKVLLQLSKQSQDIFNLKVQHPFSLMQAFGISLACFDNYTSN